MNARSIHSRLIVIESRLLYCTDKLWFIHIQYVPLSCIPTPNRKCVFSQQFVWWRSVSRPPFVLWLSQRLCCLDLSRFVSMRQGQVHTQYESRNEFPAKSVSCDSLKPLAGTCPCRCISPWQNNGNHIRTCGNTMRAVIHVGKLNILVEPVSFMGCKSNDLHGAQHAGR